MTRLAAIDIGTNSVKLIIGEVAPNGSLTVLAEDAQITRLGKGVDAAGRLNDAAIARTLDVLSQFTEKAKSLGAAQIVAAGTSALRDAANGLDFLTQAKARFNLDIEILTGDREATLAYGAVHADSSLHLSPANPLLVFDIGGGSTEFILGEGATVGRHQSLNIGAVRLTERFLHTDPPTEPELAFARAFTDAQFETFPAPETALTVAGIGGTVVNVAALHRGLPRPDPSAVHADTLTLADVQAVSERLLAVPLDQRKLLPGIEADRADILPAGVLILERLLMHFHADRFILSARGLRYGLLAECARRLEK